MNSERLLQRIRLGERSNLEPKQGMKLKPTLFAAAPPAERTQGEAE